MKELKLIDIAYYLAGRLPPYYWNGHNELKFIKVLQKFIDIDNEDILFTKKLVKESVDFYFWFIEEVKKDKGDLVFLRFIKELDMEEDFKKNIIHSFNLWKYEDKIEEEKYNIEKKLDYIINNVKQIELDIKWFFSNNIKDNHSSYFFAEIEEKTNWYMNKERISFIKWIQKNNDNTISDIILSCIRKWYWEKVIEIVEGLWKLNMTNESIKEYEEKLKEEAFRKWLKTWIDFVKF